MPRPSQKIVSTAPAAAQAATAVYAGTSGWAYATWKPGFYPPDVSSKRFLEFYATRLTSVEVNYTFRTLPTEAMLAGWIAATPEGFRFSFKAPQRITHFNRLRDCDAAVAEFVAALEPVRKAGKLGPLLFQLPPNFKANPVLLAEFLGITALSGKHAPQVAFEFRHESWFADETYEVLRKYGAAMCIAESDDLATPEVQCADGFACYRLRKTGGYLPKKIKEFADTFAELAKTRDVYVYFKHEDEPTGALNAVAFLKACTAAKR